MTIGEKQLDSNGQRLRRFRNDEELDAAVAWTLSASECVCLNIDFKSQFVSLQYDYINNLLTLINVWTADKTAKSVALMHPCIY